MARWYIGKERAALLLRFAEGELGRYAYQVPGDLYRSVLRILRTQIPLWSEERRGPLDRNGDPLYSYEGYIGFIKWWVAKMLSNQGGTSTMKVKGSWVDDVFDPIVSVVGKSKLGAAVAFSPGGGGGALNLPPVTTLLADVNIGPRTAARLYAEGLGAIYSMTNALRMEHPEQVAVLDQIIEALKAWLQPLTSSWQNEMNTPLDYANYPGPNGVGTVPIGLESGSGALDRIRDVMQRAIYFALRNAIVGQTELPQDFTGTGVKLPSTPYGRMGQEYDKYLVDPAAGRVGPEPPSGSMTFAKLCADRGDDMITLGNIVDQTKGAYTFSEINHALNQVLASDKYQVNIKIGVNNAVSGSEEQRYKMLLDSLNRDVRNYLNQ